MKTIIRAFSPQAKFLASVKLLLLLVLTFGSFVATGQVQTSDVHLNNKPGGSGQQLPTQRPVLEPLSLRSSDDSGIEQLYTYAVEPGGNGQQVPMPRLDIGDSPANEPGTVSPVQPQKKLDFALQESCQIISKSQESPHCNSLIGRNEPGGGVPSMPKKIDFSTALDRGINHIVVVCSIYSTDNQLEPGGTMLPPPAKKVDAVPDVFV